MTFWCMRQHSNQPSHPARARAKFLKLRSHPSTSLFKTYQWFLYIFRTKPQTPSRQCGPCLSALQLFVPRGKAILSASPRPQAFQPQGLCREGSAFSSQLRVPSSEKAPFPSTHHAQGSSSQVTLGQLLITTYNYRVYFQVDLFSVHCPFNHLPRGRLST